MLPFERARVAGVVLAAGSSTRMGRNKLLLELGGETVVRRTVRTAIDGGLDPVLVVLGHEAPRVEAELAGLACRTIINPKHAEGVRTSLQAGVAEVPREAHALAVVLADMPFVTATMIEDVILRYRTTGARLVVSRYGDVDAPPTLYDRSLFAELLSMTGHVGGDPQTPGPAGHVGGDPQTPGPAGHVGGDPQTPGPAGHVGGDPQTPGPAGERCAKQVARRHKDEAVIVTWPEEALRDIDVAADYEHVRARMAEG